MSAPYVALGDSFSAGIGSDSPGTQIRRDGGFPVAVARDLGLDVSYQAFLGATTLDVLLLQMDPLTPQTRLVTLTVGGNDAGFAPVLIASAQPAWLANGLFALRIAMTHAHRHLPKRLDRLYAAIRTRAPRAHIVTAGYPHLFAGIDCQVLTFFTEAEMTALNRAADDLASLSADAAGRNGARFVDVRDTFAEHEICRPEPWLHGIAWPVESSFHPTSAGHAAYARDMASVAREVLGALEAGTRAGPAMPPIPGHREPRIIEGPRRRGTADRFRLPDLLAPHSLDAAERHGLDRREVAALAARIPRGQRAAAPGAPPPDLDALHRLRELDAHVRRQLGRP